MINAPKNRIPVTAYFRLTGDEPYLEQSLRSVYEHVQPMQWVFAIQVKLDRRTQATLNQFTQELVFFYSDVVTLVYPQYSVANGPEHFKRCKTVSYVHHRSHFYNRGLQLCTQKWVLKWDGDMVANSVTGEAIRNHISKSGLSLAFYGREHYRALDGRVKPHNNTSIEVKLFPREGALYINGSHCEMLCDRLNHNRRDITAVDIYDHFKWAKPRKQITAAWPLDWPNLRHFVDLVNRKLPEAEAREFIANANSL